MARRSQSSSQGDNPLDPNYLPPHYKEYYRLALDKLAEEGEESYHQFLTEEGAPDFLCASEVEHITRHLQKPQYGSQEGGSSTDSGPGDTEADGSSGTYWPMNSDLAVPELDLGWPMVFGFRGTEVTTLVQPPPPDNPSIKEEARRMIRAAQQVVAIVMDIFTDVDLLSEVLDAAARRVPVYILLDEMNAKLFLDMAAKCRVNLNYVDFLRVRTVSGPTYYCRTGMSFKGHVKEKFLLVDCMVVLSGSYSFMWSFEKVHRSIAHIFQGELVASFDEEFRILFAQSDPLVPPANVLMNTENLMVPFGLAPFGNNMPLFPKKPHLLFPREDNLFSPFVDRVDPDRYFLSSFRRDDLLRHTLEGSAMRMYSKKIEMENAQMDPVRGFLRSKQLELDSLKRHSFAEGTFENFSASKHYSRQMFMNNLDEFKIQSSHFQKDQFYQYQFEHPHGTNRPQGLFERIRGGRPGFGELEDYTDALRNPELEPNFPQENFPVRLDYVPSNSSKEVRHGSDQVNPAGNGFLGLPPLKRQNMGQKFMCQTSPTQKQSLEQRLFLHDQGQDTDQDKKTQENKAGLRNWRISSYLSGYQSESEEGLPAAMETEPFSEAPGHAEPLPRYPSDLIASFKPSLALASAKDMAGADKAGEESSVLRQDPFRSRINPLIQRSSRLRSSLIFSAAKLDQQNVSGEKVQMIQKEQTSTEITKDNETVKTSTASKVAELLEKYKTAGKDSESTTVSHTKAMSTFLQEESQNAEKKCTKSVQYKILESRVVDSKESLSYKLHTESDAQFGVSPLASQLADALSKDTIAQINSNMDKLSSRFYPIDNKPSLPEKESLIFVGETQKLTLPEKKEKLSLKAEAQDPAGTELTKTVPAQTSTTSTTEGSSKNRDSETSVSKPEEEVCKQEQSPREFFRKGSLRLKQLLNPKGEKKSEEETTAESWKPDKQSLGLKRSSKGDLQEITEEEKSPKLTSPPVLKGNPPRFPSSTANVLYSSNLRDDTKVILEQISANSQKNRAELARQLPVAANPELSKSTTSLDNKGDEKSTGISRSESFGSHRRHLQRDPSEDRDSLLKRMESMRKEKRVYSRFEVFCKKDEHGEEECDADAKDKKMGKFMPKLLGTFKTKK
ncbi:protein FAM83H isoform X2 [Sphaerodactylus townsendi]|nr:protein FAM83H isoform X2 [Sphaerodactylus townsendi]XP_048338583.1 protein FAM83H isoform X2 [Sphaerodactylus townsendi]XP_048338584.1 protein FAM83H isoform X2 [Sphaerodactylus townsendi]XP_048338585.1 protein FAM83H isoform X2 [Sphaerodactylus townsendi]XP_048338587.1 protein FAM83H isoform X2 [Sphaerodactylus townsendi]